jgi:hypothetical protein
LHFVAAMKGFKESLLAVVALTVAACEGHRSDLGPPSPEPQPSPQPVAACADAICVDSKSTLLGAGGRPFSPSLLMIESSHDALLVMLEETGAGAFRLDMLVEGAPLLGQAFDLRASSDPAAAGGVEWGTRSTQYIEVVYSNQTDPQNPKPASSGSLTFSKFGTDDGSPVAASLGVTFRDGKQLSLSFAGNRYLQGGNVPCTDDNALTVCGTFAPDSVCVDDHTLGYYNAGMCVSGRCEWPQLSDPCGGACVNGACQVHFTVGGG